MLVLVLIVNALQHRETEYLKPHLGKMCARCGEGVPIGDAHLKCLANRIICPIFRLRFANGEELAQVGLCFFVSDTAQI